MKNTIIRSILALVMLFNILSIIIVIGRYEQKTTETCDRFMIEITGELEQNYKDSNYIIESKFCCNRNGKCDNCVTDKGVLWLWGLIENATSTNVDVKYLGCIK